MRQYRGKKLESERWVYGDYFRIFNGLKMNGNHYSHFIMQDTNNVRVEVDPKTVGQYTGLKITNGVEVFEGDIVKVSYAGGGHAISISPVWFEGGRFVFEEKSPFAKAWTVSTLYSVVDHLNYKIEVIGSIHDNPELLEEV